MAVEIGPLVRERRGPFRGPALSLTQRNNLKRHELLIRFGVKLTKGLRPIVNYSSSNSNCNPFERTARAHEISGIGGSPGV